MAFLRSLLCIACLTIASGAPGRLRTIKWWGSPQNELTLKEDNHVTRADHEANIKMESKQIESENGAHKETFYNTLNKENGILDARKSYHHTHKHNKRKKSRRMQNTAHFWLSGRHGQRNKEMRLIRKIAKRYRFAG